MKKWQKIVLIILGTYIVSAISLYVYEVVTFEAKYQANEQRIEKIRLGPPGYQGPPLHLDPIAVSCNGKIYNNGCPLNKTTLANQLHFLITSPITNLAIPAVKFLYFKIFFPYFIFFPVTAVLILIFLFIKHKSKDV